jgi:ubiquitin-activating enzyme E1
MHPAPRTRVTHLPAAKNVILAGVRSVTIHDTADVQTRDLSAQFYLTEADVGRNRAEACKDKLQELNTAVAVHASTAELTDAFLKGFQVRLSRPMRPVRP